MSKKISNAVCKNLKMLLLLLAVIAFFVLTSEKSYAEEIKEYVGSATCAMCHEGVAQRFELTEHSQAIAGDGEDLGEGCESCHGAGSLHADSQDKKDIVRNSTENCFKCHVGERARFQLQYHHPVPEGRMECSDCHVPHGSPIETLDAVSLRKADQVCFNCHKEMKGPFVFEHDPMRDGCQTCHEPHGSVYDKLLIADQTNVCLRCHWEPAFNSATADLGGVSHSGYDIGKGEECVDHHRAPHGSNIWKTLNR